MADTTSNTRVSPQEIEAMIAKASQEPGLNEIIGLLKLSHEASQIEHLQAEMLIQPCAAQVAGTVGWVY
jgi:hypothetical protein